MVEGVASGETPSNYPAKRVLLETQNLVKTYGKGASAFHALRGVNLKIYQNESLAIVGKSGSGKSTLMHVLALLDEPSEGTIVVEGMDAKSLKGKQLNKFRNEKFGFVFQQFFMNANDSVLNNVLLPLKIAKLSGRRRKKLARHALESVDLTDKVKSIANDLSGGQKQRVCIARAIVNKPEIIFADEPTGNLDSETSELIEKLLFGIREKQSSTLIIVTHDEELAEKCDRRIVIKDGRIV